MGKYDKILHPRKKVYAESRQVSLEEAREVVRSWKRRVAEDKAAEEKARLTSPEPYVHKVPHSILEGLGILGWETLERPILAAMLAEHNTMFIGPHGTAKTMAVERLARAL